MTTKVSPTSIAAYHDPEVQDLIATQFQRVSAYVVAQTKAGKAVCIGSIWSHFSLTERKGLGQISSVSRVCNELSKPEAVIIVDGKEYRYEARPSKKFNGRMVIHFCLVLKYKPSEAVQTELF